LRKSKHRRGPVGQKVAALFAGLLRDAAAGDKLLTTKQGRTGIRILRPVRSMDGASRCVSFPSQVFESAILSMLREI
jgi:hypothetical protein